MDYRWSHTVNTKERHFKKTMHKNSHNMDIANKYKLYRKQSSQLIKATKYEFYKSKIKQNLNDPKKTWKTIKEATNDQVVRNEIKCILHDDNEKITDDRLKAREFNAYFSNIAKKLISRTKFMGQGYQAQKTREIRESFYLTPITETELLNQLNSLKTGVSCGEEGITAKLSK
ncbi:hypothetical protein HHI36_004077 [Cryptolaemus montrouzieri]|uniref:Uncharacterized protein n=1 Tax=Cryptolaemus montrouzieri TaxID=559131 RepID=A0ABD2NQ54_9CUCU